MQRLPRHISSLNCASNVLTTNANATRMSRGAGSHVTTISPSSIRLPQPQDTTRKDRYRASSLPSCAVTAHHSRLKAHNIVRTANVEPRAYAAATARFTPWPEDETMPAGSIVEETLSARLDRMLLMQMQQRLYRFGTSSPGSVGLTLHICGAR
jgi:hypothetical protein